jgi:uncharacterized protein YbjT (DUF2867 family)
MADPKINVVTGAFSFTGACITRRLLDRGEDVITLTGHPERPNEFGERVKACPFNFDNPAQLAESLSGATTLYNTYWIRFAHGGLSFEQAVENTKTLIKAAEDAGVRRIVHVSITNPSEDSPLPYFKGKAQVERAIMESKLTHAILRPAVLFGDQAILINNIAWFLRRLPVFAIPGSGEYGLQPIYVEDLADLAVGWGHKDENAVFDAVGPDAPTFNELVRWIAQAVGSKTLILHVPPALALIATGLLGKIVGDVVLTPDEVKGLEANLLLSKSEPTARTSLKEWISANADWLGTRYFSEVRKHF